MPPHSGLKSGFSPVGGACGNYGGQESCIEFCVCVWEEVWERDNLENLRIDGKIISKINLQGVGWGDIDWIALSQDKDSRRELLNAVMNLRVP